jgi:outer membrane protein assembly factor BamB
LTYHKTNWRDGFESSGTFISPHLSWTSQTLDGIIYAEPLVANHMVYVATEGDSIYALNENSGQILWKTNLGSPVPASDTDVNASCWAFSTIGITSTPAIDPNTGTLYAVGLVQPGEYELFALNINSGQELWARNVDPQGMNPLVQLQRPALALANGYLYIGFGGAGDCGSYKGYLVAAPESNSGSLLTYELPTIGVGTIWGSSGPAIDNSTGDIFVSTGNSGSQTTFDYGEAVIKLSPTLHVLSYFAPSNWAMLNQEDRDLGSVGPTILNDNTIFQIGKEGIGYLLQMSDLGGIGGQEFSSVLCSHGPDDEGSFGGVAYAPPYLYVPCVGSSAGIVALKVNLSDSSPSFSQVWNSSGYYYIGPPIVADGAVWAIGRNEILYALNGTNGAVLFSSSIGTVAHFATPSADGNMIFTAGSQSVQAFSSSDSDSVPLISQLFAIQETSYLIMTTATIGGSSIFFEKDLSLCRRCMGRSHQIPLRASRHSRRLDSDHSSFRACGLPTIVREKWRRC